MPLTWKWSTNTGKLSASVKTSLLTKPKKKWLLTSIVDKIRWAWAKAHQLTQTPEAKAIKHVVTNPWEVISTWLRETSKATWKAWAFLEDAGRQAEASKLPVISQAGSITRAAWTLVWGPEATRQNILRIWDQVKKWEITVADWILEAGTSTGLQGITLIAAPFLQAINSWLNITWLDEPLERWIAWGTNFLTDLTQKTLGLTKEKAQSRVNSALNVLRWVGMYKWGKIINKGWAWNFVKWSTVISSPDIALSTLAFVAKEEWKDIPTPEVLKGITANVATALVPAPWQVWKGPKGSVTPPKSLTTPKTNKKTPLSQVVKETKLPKELQVKQTPEVKKSLEAETIPTETKKLNFKKQKQAEILAKYWKENISKIQNFTQELATIQEIRKNPKEFAGIYSAKELLAMKNKAIKDGIKLWMIESTWTDKWAKSYTFTEAAHNDFNIRTKNDYLWVWVHTPKTKPTKLSQKVKEKITEAPKDDFIKEMESTIEPTPKAIERNISTEYNAAKKAWYKGTKAEFIQAEFKNLLDKDPQKTFEILDPYENMKPWVKSIWLPDGTRADWYPSSFPKDIPEHLRRKSLYDNAMKVIRGWKLPNKSATNIIDMVNFLSRKLWYEWDILNPAAIKWLKDAATDLKKQALKEKRQQTRIDKFAEGIEKDLVASALNKTKIINKIKKDRTLDQEQKNFLIEAVQWLKESDKISTALTVRKVGLDTVPKTDLAKTSKELVAQRELWEPIKEVWEAKVEFDADWQPIKAKVFRDKKSFIDDDWGQKSNIDYFGKDEYKNLKARLNIAAKRFKKSWEATIKWRLTDIAKWAANIGLETWKTIKDVALSTIWGFLDAVVTVDQNWNKQTLWDLMGWIKWRLTSVRENTSKVLNIAMMDKFLEKNIKSIDAWFDFIKWQDLKKLIPWTDVASRMRRFFIEKAQNANELYSKNLWEKQPFANKIAVVAQYVGWEIKARLRALKQKEIDAINEKKISQEAKNDLINEIFTSPEDIARVQNEVISTMPVESQKFLNDYFNLYGQFKDDTILKRGFETIWSELNEKGILKNPKENYTHGYVPDEILREYIRISGKDMWFNKQDISAFLKEGRPLTPEQRSSILKQSNNVWYLHSQDPASIAHSYLNETQELIHHKMIDDLLDAVSKDDPEVKNYLRELDDQNSKIYNDVKDISRPKKIAIRAVDKYLNASAYWLYILNPTLIAQNAFTSWIYGLWKAVSNLITWKGSYWKDVFTVKNRNPTAEYLFNKWLISHRDIDSNIWFKWDATTWEKIVRNTKKYVWEQPMQKSTALWVKTIQVITANAFMKKFVWDNIKEGETIVDAYKRKLATLTPEEKLKAETDLYREVVSIENPTNLNKATKGFFDIKLFGMVTAWARWNSSFIVSKTMDVIDTVHNNIQAAAKKKWYTKIKDGKSIDNMTMVTTKVVLAYTAAKILWEMLYDDDDDRQDEVKKRLNAASLKDNMTYFLTHSTWLAGANIWSRNFGYLTDYGIQLMDAYENWDEEAAAKATWEFTDRWFSGIKKFKDAIKWDQVQTTKSWEFKYQDVYDDKTFWDAIWRVMWLSKPAAEYSQSYDRLTKLERELKQESAQYNAWGLMFDELKRHLPSLPTSSKDMQNVKFRIKVDRLNRNIKDLWNEKVWFDEWMNKIYEGIEAPSEARTEAEKKLWEWFVKNADRNLKTIWKLQHVLKEINSVKWVEVFPNDFWRTLESLKWTHPKLYNKFMKQVYWTISAEGITPELREANAKFIDNVISADLGWEMLATNISWLVRRIAWLDVDLKREAWTIVSDRDKLESLEKVLGTLENAPVLQEQILSSLSELVNLTINKDNAQDIYDSIQDYPIIQTLYKRAAELRWAVLLDDVEKEVEKPEETSTIIPEPKLSWKINTKWNNLWTLPTFSEKKKNKLIDLIDLEAKQQTEPKLEKVNLQTLLDKVL